MAEYIERWKARDAIEDADSYYTYVIDKLPSADVAPVRHGHWIHEKDKRWMGGGKTVCSVCESGLSDGGYIAVRTFSYCPSCGAKMDQK